MPIAKAFKEEGCAPVKIWTDDIDENTLSQVKTLATLPFIHHHVAVMADCHWGMGSTVGSVIPTFGAIIPAAVGVDIGCGMSAVKLPLKASSLPDSLANLRAAIEKAVPHGRTDNGGVNDRGAWGTVPKDVGELWEELTERSEWQDVILGKHRGLIGKVYGARQLGTLGTGNHFIEVCLDLDANVWVMLHSGSRGIGNKIGTHFISLAKEDMGRFFIHLPDDDLAYLPEDTEHFNDYLKAVRWAQDYALINRNIMMRKTIEAIENELGVKFEGNYVTAVNCHHNYVAMENHFGKNVYVTRKGAVRARQGDLGIIPGSMGARSFIVRGKGNPESFDSCSHGAGRRMSRGAAKKAYTCKDLIEQTNGVECRKDAEVIDEIPGAYKDIQTVMDNQSDLVEIVAELKQVLCVKG